MRQRSILLAGVVAFILSPLMAGPSSVEIGGVVMSIPEGWKVQDGKMGESRTVISAERTHAITILKVNTADVDSVTSPEFQSGVLDGLKKKGMTILDQGPAEIAGRPAFRARYASADSSVVQEMLVVVVGRDGYAFVAVGAEPHPTEVQEIKTILSNVRISGPKNTAAFQAGYRFGQWAVSVLVIGLPTLVVLFFVRRWKRRQKASSN